MLVAMERLRDDPQAQPRVHLNFETVEAYQNDMAEGAVFPPLTVFHDGENHWIADGFHRFHAARQLGLAEIECDVRHGTLRDAILFSCSANASHGLRRTNEDKRRAVMRMLEDVKWSTWSVNDISRHCAVAVDTVWRLKKSILSVSDSMPPPPSVSERVAARAEEIRGAGGEPRFFTHPKTGETSVMNTTAIGGRKAASPRAIVVAPQEDTHAWIAIALEDLAGVGRKLPEPEDAARRIPRNLRRSINSQELRDLADWLGAFCSEWDKAQERAA